MSDLYHEKVPIAFVHQVFDVMLRADWHIYQILTKRSQRLVELARDLPWRPHIWQGVSVENARYTFRIKDLKSVPAAVRFLSLEPLLGPLRRLPLLGIHWVIVGGESGPFHRPIDPIWVREIRSQCLRAGVPFFFKQWGGITSKSGGRLLDGRLWNQLPQQLKERGIQTA
jgi:protein gp37